MNRPLCPCQLPAAGLRGFLAELLETEKTCNRCRAARGEKEPEKEPEPQREEVSA